MKIGVLVVGLLFGLMLNPEVRADALPGVPPLARFSPTLDVFPQNFGLTQDRDGLLYVGNYEGVLVFDGARWRKVGLPGGSLARSLAFDGENRVYVGGDDVFGYIAREADGTEVFHDLTGMLPEPLRSEGFADIWNILVSPEGVFFRGLRHTFLYRPDQPSIKVWEWPGRFGAMVWHQGAVWLQFRGEGLRRLEDGDFVPISGSASLTEQIYGLIPLPDGSLLMLTSEGLWQRFSNGQVVDARMPDRFPPTTQFDRYCVLADGQIALGSVDGWVYVLDVMAGTSRQFRVGNDRIAGMIVNRFGGLLLLSDIEVIFMNWPATWTVLGAETGLSSSVYHIIQWGERLLALTSAGVFSHRPGTEHFEPTEWTPFEAWDLLVLNDSDALLAESYALLSISDNRIQPVSHRHLYPRVLLRSTRHDDVVFIGTELGYAVARNGDQGWQLIQENDEFPALVTSLVEGDNGLLWLGTQGSGVWRIEYNENYQVKSQTAVSHELGIDYGNMANALILRSGESLLASTEEGLYRWDGDRFVAEDVETLGRTRRPSEWLSQIVGDKNTGLWASSYNHIYHRSVEGRWRDYAIGSFLKGALYRVALIEGKPWFGASNSIIRYNPGLHIETAERPTVRLRQIIYGLPGNPRQRALTPDRHGVFETGEFSLTFQFGLPDYQRLDAVRYRVRLAGFETQWPEWETGSVVTYSALEPGDYQLEVQARDSDGFITSAPNYSFTIEPPWYATNAARVSWLLGIMLLVSGLTWGLQRWRMQRLHSSNLELGTPGS